MELYIVFYCDDQENIVGVYDSEEKAERATKILNKDIGIAEDDDEVYEDAYYYVCGPTVDVIIEEETL